MKTLKIEPRTTPLTQRELDAIHLALEQYEEGHPENLTDFAGSFVRDLLEENARLRRTVLPE